MRIGPRAVVGGGAVLEDGCVIRESVVWPSARVVAGSTLVRAVVGRTTILENMNRKGAEDAKQNST